MVFSEKFALFANSVAYFSWIIFFNSIFKWLKPRLIENNLILAKNPKNQCLKFSDFSTKSGSVVKGLVILKLNVPNFGPFYYLCYFRNCSIQHLQKIISKLICAKVCTLIAKSSKWKRFAILQCICVGLTFFSQLNLSEMLDYGQNQWPNSGQVKCSAVLVLHLKKLYQCAILCMKSVD